MIASIAVIAIGIFILWLSRKSRNINQRINKMSPQAKKDLIDTVNRDHDRHFLVGGSVTNIPTWIVVLVLILFAVAFWGAASSIT